MSDNTAIPEGWASIVDNGGKPKIIAYDGRWMDQHVPMSLAEAVESLIRAEESEERLRQRVALIPEEMRDIFIPRIKQPNREYAQAMSKLGSEIELNEDLVDMDAVTAAAEKDLVRQLRWGDFFKWAKKSCYDEGLSVSSLFNVCREAVCKLRGQSAQEQHQAEFFRQHPEFARFKERMAEIGTKYTDAETLVFTDFLLHGGTEEQYDDLRQAVLNRHFSAPDRPRPRPPPLPSSGPQHDKEL